MSKEKVNIGKIIDEETERRLQIMQESDYEWPAKAGKGDIAVIISSIVVCIVLILLCIMGVIV